MTVTSINNGSNADAHQAQLLRVIVYKHEAQKYLQQLLKKVHRQMTATERGLAGHAENNIITLSALEVTYEIC